MRRDVAPVYLARAVTWRRIAESCQFGVNRREARAFMRRAAYDWRRAVGL